MSLLRLFRPSERERPHLDELRQTLLDDLHRRSAATVWFLIPVLFLFREIVRPAYDVDAAVRWAFWSTVAVAFARWGVVIRHRRQPALEPAEVLRRFLRFSVATALLGLGQAATIYFAAPRLEFSRLALVAVFLAGVHSVALGSMAASPRTYTTYIIPGLSSLIWALLERPRGTQENLLLGMIGFYIPVLSLMCLYAHRGVRRTIVLGFELRALALKDVLTGLPNRRFLTEFMDREVSQTLRAWRGAPGVDPARRPDAGSLGLLILDLDRFKSVNDEHGHAAGDEVLRQFARVVQQAVRRPDLVVRWGGEEFVVVARGLARDAVWELAGRIRRRVEEHGFVLPSGDSVRRTCSIGFCLFPFSEREPDALGWEQSLALADHALYQAKEQGRNRVVGVVSGASPVERGDALVRAVSDDFDGSLSRGLVRLARDLPPATVSREG